MNAHTLIPVAEGSAPIRSTQTGGHDRYLSRRKGADLHIPHRCGRHRLVRLASAFDDCVISLRNQFIDDGRRRFTAFEMTLDRGSRSFHQNKTGAP